MKQGKSRSLQRVAAFCLFFLLVILPISGTAASRFIFAVNFIAGSISTYQVDAETGMLHHLRFTPTLEGPATLVLRPDGKFLYVTSQVLDKIAIYRVDQTKGTLTEIEQSPVDSGVRSNFRMAMSPDGRLLYVPGRFTSNLMVFRSDPETGEITPLEENNFPTHGKRTRYIEVTADGRFVYVTNTVSGTLAAFRVDSENKTVTAIEGMPFRVGGTTIRENNAGETIVGDSPQQAIADPSGKFLYVPNWITGEISAFSINSSSGALTTIPDIKTETGIFPFSGSIHPDGKNLYIANWLSYDISGYHINTETGQLTPIEGMPIPAEGDAPINVRFDDEGRFAYVPTYHDSSLTIFQVDRQTGKLVNPRKIMTRPAVRRLAMLKGEPVRFETRWMVTSDYEKAADKTTIRSYAISSYAVNPETGEPTITRSAQLEGATKTLAMQTEAGLVFVGQGEKLSVLKMNNKGRLQKTNVNIEPDGNIQALYVDQRGHYLYLTTHSPAQYLAYEINEQTGELKEIKRVKLPDDVLPTKITSSPEQRLNFVLDSAGNRIFMFRFLTKDGPNMFHMANRGSPFSMAAGLSDIEIDTTGRFGLMAQSEGGTVAVYSLPTIWNPLKPVGNKPLSVGKQPVAITRHPRGKYFYVLDAGTNSIFQLRLNSNTGELKMLGKRVTLNGKPKALVMEPGGRFAYLQYVSRQGVTRFDINKDTGQLSSPVDMLKAVSPTGLAIVSSIQ